MKCPHSSLKGASRPLVWLLGFLLFGASLLPGLKTSGAASRLSPHRQRTTGEWRAGYGRLPLRFEANRGQAASAVRFLARGRGGDVFFTATGATMGAVHLQFAAANAQPRISGLEKLPGRSHYFLGDDSRNWVTGAAHYARIKYEALYPGIDLFFYGGGSDRRQLEYDFVVAPGAKPEAIKLRFKGARNLRLAANGDLLIETGAGEMRQHKPFIYQETDGVKHEIASRYVIKSGQVGFDLARYDTGKPLVIDPVLSYSTFLGGQDVDAAEAIAVDAEGNAYVTGWTPVSENFPFTFPMKPEAPPPTVIPPTRSGTFIFVTKLNADGSDVLYSAIIGGTRGIRDFQSTSYWLENRSQAIAVDAQGKVYVTGQTHSENFPVTAGTIQAFSLPSQFSNEAFVFKLNADGTALDYSTMLGRGAAEGNGIAVDRQGQAWVTGGTSSRTFPVTPDAFQKTMKNTSSSVFVAKLNATGTQLLHATYLSSGSAESGRSVALDADGNAYVSGTTGSSCARNDGVMVEPFPTTEGAFRRDPGEGCNGPGSSTFLFVSKFSPTGALAYSTLVGAGDGGFIAVDAQGNAYVSGRTVKLYNFPVTTGAFQTEIIGPPTMAAAFVTKLNAQGSALVYSTYLNGATGNEGGQTRLVVDQAGNAYVTGALSAFTFVRTTTDPPFDALRGVFVTKLAPAGGSAAYSVLLGEGNSAGIAVDAAGNAFITGFTSSNEFPATSNAFQRQRQNVASNVPDAFVARIGERAPPRAATHVSAASYAGASLAGEAIIAAFGTGLAMTTDVATSSPLPTALAGTTIKVKDSLGVEREAPLFFVSPTQVNYLLPAGTAIGAAAINITSGDGSVSTATVLIENVAPALFTADASGRGLAAAVALRIKTGGEQSYEAIARYDTLQSRMMPMPIELGPNGEQVFLILYGTGLRHHAGLANVAATIGGSPAQVIYAGTQGEFFGLDQVNLLIPRSLIGRGEADIVLTVDGKMANTVKVWVK